MARYAKCPPAPEKIETVIKSLREYGPSTIDSLCLRTGVWEADSVLKFLIAARAVVREVVETGERTSYHNFPVRRALFRLATAAVGEKLT